MSGAMSRSVATKFMFFCIGVSVMAIIWSMAGSLSRSREAREEASRVHTATLGGVPVLVPTPAGAVLQKNAESPVPGLHLRLVFSRTRTGRNPLVHIFAFTELDEMTGEEFGAEEFADYKEYMTEILNLSDAATMQDLVNERLNKPDARLEYDKYRILENTDDVFTIETMGRMVKDGKIMNAVVVESYGVVKRRLYRLAATSIAPADQQPAPILEPLRQWRQAIVDANNEQ